MKKVLAVLKAVVDNPAVRSRAYETGVAVLGALATADALNGSTVGALVQYAAGALLVMARTKVQKPENKA